eukprot:2458455-Pleurochrysis_carterae.AAC.1
MGTTGVKDYELTWLAGVHTTGELLPSTHMAVLRLYWRHVYAAMIRTKFDKEPFSINAAKVLLTWQLHFTRINSQAVLTFWLHPFGRRLHDRQSRRPLCTPTTRHGLLRSKVRQHLFTQSSSS